MPRAFLFTLAAVNSCLALAGVVYAVQAQIPASTAAPIVAAFLLQVSFYLVPGFPQVRRSLEDRLSPARLATLAVAAAVIPYLLYSLTTGVFQFPALLKLLAICIVPTVVFVLAPTKSPGLTWQDLVAGGTVAGAVLGKLLRQIYRSPIEGLRLESMGQIMLLGLGATAFLSLRGLEGSGFQFGMTRDDWKTGIKQFVFFLPLGAVAGVGVGYLRLGGQPFPWAEPWMYPFLVLGTFLGMYFIVALAEELFFRGILQNLATTSLGSAVGAQALASLLFGLSHLPFRRFPNWRFALLAAIAGWFYGQAYRERRSVVASSITHALVNTASRLLLTT